MTEQIRTVSAGAVGSQLPRCEWRCGLPAVVALLLAVSAAGTFADVSRPEAVELSPPETPREFFNAGTRRLKEGKLREAEGFLCSALGTQQERIQPAALYNLGHTRFGQGLEELKKGPSAGAAAVRARTSVMLADQAIDGADGALAGVDVQRLVDSYLRGRGARRELKEAAKAVRRAMQSCGAALSKWERASGDFKSALELDPRDSDSRQNAETVDRAIAKLVDSIRDLQQAAAAMDQKKQELGEKMKELKGRIPEEDMPPGAPGDEEEEEEELEGGSKPGEKEAPSREGEEMAVPPELAGWLLESFKLDTERRLPMGQNDSTEPKTRSRKPW